MSKLQALLEQRSNPGGTIKARVTERFLDGEGNAAEWEIRGITRERNQILRERCVKWVPKERGESMAVPEIDFDEYATLLAVESTVFPDLNDSELQASYGARDSAELLKTMLLPGELEKYKTLIQEYYGFGQEYEYKLEETMEGLITDGERDAVLAYQCLAEFHWPPSALMSMSVEERAFLSAAIKRMQKERETRSRQSRQSLRRRI